MQHRRTLRARAHPRTSSVACDKIGMSLQGAGVITALSASRESCRDMSNGQRSHLFAQRELDMLWYISFVKGNVVVDEATHQQSFV